MNTEPKERAIIVSMCIGGFLIPVGIMIICYTYIVLKLKDRKKLQVEFEGYKKNKSPALLSNEDKNEDGDETNRKKSDQEDRIRKKFFDDEPPNEQGSRKKSKKIAESDKRMNLFIKSEIKATKNALIIITLFTIAWFPYTIVALLAQFSENRNYYVTPYSTTLSALFAKTSAIYNPIVYALTNRKFKIKFGQCFPYFRRNIRTLRRSFMSNSWSGTISGSRKNTNSNGPNASLKRRKSDRTKVSENSIALK